MSRPEDVVHAQLEAYNRHDMEAFVATYHPGIRICRFPHGDLLMAGHDGLRAGYRSRFAPGSRIRAEVVTRIVQGNLVIDAERIRGVLPDRDLEATAIYEVEQGLITRAWFIRDWPEAEVAAALAAAGTEPA
jgi:hypothetical protein